MKNKRIIIILLSVLGVGISCFYIWYQYLKVHDNMINSYENQVKEYEANEKIMQEQLEKIQYENEKLKMQISQIKEEKLGVEEELEKLTETIKNVHMTPPETEFYESIKEKKYMLGENVNLRKIPSDSSEFYSSGTLSYVLVTTHAVVFEMVMDLYDKTWKSEDRHWVLVSYHSFSGDLSDSFGWVKFSELIEYTEETKELLKGGFTLAENAIDLETGSLAHPLLRGQRVAVKFMDNCAQVFTNGGISCYVDKKYIIYPEVE